MSLTQVVASKFLDLKIQTKLGFATAGAIVLTVAVGLTGFLALQQMSDLVADEFPHELKHQQFLSSVSLDFRTLESDVVRAIARRDEGALADLPSSQRLASSLALVRSEMTSEGEREVFTELETRVSRFRAVVQELQSAVQQRQQAQAVQIMSGPMAAAVADVNGSLDQLHSISQQDSRALVDAGSTMVKQAEIIILGLVASMVVLGSILGLIIARSVSRPIADLVRSIHTADLHTRFESARKDEVGDLMRSFDGFILTIKDTLTRVGEASAAVASAAAEISASTEQMAAGAQEQSSQVMEVSAAVEEMSKTIGENSRNAGTTAETARAGQEAAVKGGQTVSEGVAGIRKIVEVVQSSSTTVRSLGKSSAQIGQIVSVIDDIADQTNLLALNAAIEAARAGEQGRGFAVVADEVRRLAERTTTATKEIADMIRRIQQDTADAVSVIERGAADANLGIQSADAAGNTLREIEAISRQVSDMVLQIASASEQQARASEQIAKSVEGISGVTQETATGLQQVARTAEDLSHLTDNLETLMNRFQLGASTVPKRGAVRETIGQMAVRENGHVVPLRDQRMHTS